MRLHEAKQGAPPNGEHPSINHLAHVSWQTTIGTQRAFWTRTVAHGRPGKDGGTRRTEGNRASERCPARQNHIVLALAMESAVSLVGLLDALNSAIGFLS